MLWLTIWFTVILKIPAIYLAYVIWWSVKTRLPRPLAERGRVSVAEGSSHRGVVVRTPIPGRRPGPHGTSDRRRRPQPALAASLRRTR